MTNVGAVVAAVKTSPATAARIESRLWETSDIVKLIDAREAKPNRPATYRKSMA